MGGFEQCYIILLTIFMNKEDLENTRLKYSAVLSMKASEGEIQWSRYNAMLVVNTIIIVLIGFEYGGEKTFPDFFHYLFQLIPFLGLLLCYAWQQMTSRGFRWTKFWMERAYDMEFQISGLINPVQEGRRLRDSIGEGVTKSMSLAIINIFATIYFCIHLFHMYNFSINVYPGLR